MTVLEELIDCALQVCEKSRNSGLQMHNHSRAAVLLSKSGRTYTGCDVHLNLHNSSPSTSEANGVTAERASFLAAVADGASEFDVRLAYARAHAYVAHVLTHLSVPRVPLLCISPIYVPHTSCLILLVLVLVPIFCPHTHTTHTHTQCLVLCSDTMKSFPAPDGMSREFMRSFGIYPVVLINCNLEVK
jgi:cytidine deaminase